MREGDTVDQKSLCQAGDAVSESAMLYPAYDCDYAAPETLAYKQGVQ